MLAAAPAQWLAGMRCAKPWSATRQGANHSFASAHSPTSLATVCKHGRDGISLACQDAASGRWCGCWWAGVGVVDALLWPCPLSTGIEGRAQRQTPPGTPALSELGSLSVPGLHGGHAAIT